MTANTKKYLIISSSVVLVSTLGIWAYISYRNKNLYNAIVAALDSGVNQYGSLMDMPGFKGKAYQDTIPSNLNVIKLKDAAARKFADTINKSFGIVRNDNAAILQAFNQLKDQYELSQVPSVYQSVYTKPLLDDITGKIYSSSDIDNIYKVVKQYKPYRISA